MITHIFSILLQLLEVDGTAQVITYTPPRSFFFSPQPLSYLLSLNSLQKDVVPINLTSSIVKGVDHAGGISELVALLLIFI